MCLVLFKKKKKRSIIVIIGTVKHITNINWCRHHYQAYFTDEEAEAQRG